MGQGETVSRQGPMDTVLPSALGRVNRSMGQGDIGSRQGTMNTVVSLASRVARPEVPPAQSRVSGQGLMKQGPNQSSQAFSEGVFDNMMEQIADWDYPGNIVRQALCKPPAPVQSSHVADSGQSRGQAGAVQPVQTARPRGQPAGAGPTLEVLDRLASGRSSDGHDLVVQDSGVDIWSSRHRS